MPYIGSAVSKSTDIKRITFATTTTGSGPFALGWTPASENTLRVTINGVVQQDSSITLSGANLTLVGVSLVSGDELEVQGIVNVGAMDGIPMDGSVTEGKIGGNAVTAAKIASGAVTSAKIGADAVGASAIATGAVGATEIAANSITVAQMSRAGTSGQVLTSAGTGADATWSTVALPDATPRWLAYVGTNQSLTNNTNTTFEYDTERYDSDGAFDTSTYTFTVPTGEAGVYFGYCSAYHVGSNINAHQQAMTQLNMGGTTFWMEINSSNHWGQHYSVAAFGLAVLSEGDTCFVKGKSIWSPGSMVIGAGAQESFFGGWRVA